MRQRRPETRFYTKKGKQYVRRNGIIYRLKEVRPFYKEPKNRVIAILSIIIIVLLVNLAGEDQSEAQNSDKTVESSTRISESGEGESQQSSDSAPKEETEIPYGAAGESDGLSLIVNEVTESDSINAVGGYGSYKPDEGAKFALVNINLKNVGDKAVSTSNGWFKLVAGETVYSPSTLIVTGTDQNFITFESINPGLEQNGYLAFEVPKDFDVRAATLRFDGTGIFDDPIVFLLS